MRMKLNNSPSSIVAAQAVARSLWIALFAALLVAAPGVPAQAQDQAQDNAPVTLHVQAPAQVATGEAIPLTLQISGDAARVGGMEALTLFDVNAAEFAAFYPSFTATQAGLGTLLVPENEIGATVGFFTCATPECQEVSAALASMASAGTAAVGADTLATIEVLPLVAGQLEIRLDNVQIVDHAGHALPVVLEQAAVTVQVGEGGPSFPAPVKPWDIAVAQNAAQNGAQPSDEVIAAAADVTGDQMVSHADVMETALSWQIVHEQLAACGGAEAAADVNADHCVTVADVQLAAAHIGATVPEPESPPVDPSLLPNQLYLPSVQTDTSGEVENAEAAAAKTFVVNGTSDQADAKIGDGICRAANGECTLRAAIAEANRHSGPDTINFAIPGSGVQTIQLASRLPSLSDASGGTTINGYTQPGSAANTDGRVSNARIMIQVRGQDLAFDALAITTSNNVVRGLSFFNLNRSLWIYGTGAKQNTVAGCIVGTDAATSFLPSSGTSQQAHGIMLEQGAQQNHIGGTANADRNVISGNRRSGIGMWHWPTNNNTVYNNLIGLSADGNRRVANRAHGVDMNFGASFNLIGGTEPGQHNVVSGNSIQGIEVSHTANTAYNQIVGNYVGTYASGNVIGGITKNGGFGIQLKDRVTNNHVAYNVIGNNDKAGIMLDNFGNCCLKNNVVEYNRVGIGINGAAMGNRGNGIRVLAPGTRIGPDNIIANNSAGGIVIEGDGSDGNTITQNSIYANAGLGIDLAPVGAVNANDAGDGDSGPNQQLNFPIINSARTTQVSGTGCGGCTIEIFVASGPVGANGQGRAFVGTGVASGNGSFSIAIRGVATGNVVTATATDAAGNTSEFAVNVKVQ
jgi:hypothetical protein